MGDADHEDKYSMDLKAKAKKYPDIILTGFLKGQLLHELYSHAGLFVLASYYEGLPIVLLEAMSYGLPCISSDIPANRNVPMDDERFFRTDDAGGLCKKIETFIGREWSEANREVQISMVGEKYNWENIAKETLEAYKCAL